MQCTNCKSEILATAKFCPECGNKVENLGKTCPNKDCNRSGLPQDAVFCPDCGTKLPESDKSVSHTFSMRETEKGLNAESLALEILRREKDQITQRIAKSIDIICIDISIEIDKRFSGIIKYTPQWIIELQIKSIFDTFHPKDSAKQIIDEILKKYQTKLEKEQIDWTTSTLNPFVQEKMEDLQEELRTKLESFYLEVDAVKMKLSGVDVNVKAPSKGERIGAAIVGLYVDAGSAVYDAQFGFVPGLFKQMALQINAIFTMLLVGCMNPIVIKPIIMNDAFMSILNRGTQVERTIKQEVANKICAQIQTERAGQSEKMLIEQRRNLQKLTKSISNSLTNELNSVEEQINKILEEKRKGVAKLLQLK